MEESTARFKCKEETNTVSKESNKKPNLFLTLWKKRKFLYSKKEKNQFPKSKRLHNKKLKLNKNKNQSKSLSKKQRESLRNLSKG